jgi:hypothetical protein
MPSTAVSMASQVMELYGSAAFFYRPKKINREAVKAWKGKSKLLILLSLGSNQKPSGCLGLAVITAERATNCATEDGEDCRFCGSNTVPPECVRLK